MNALSLTVGVLACLAVASGAEAATKRAASPNAYDGRWSVMVITEQGACDRASRLSLGISNGRIEMADAMAAAAGRKPPVARTQLPKFVLAKSRLIRTAIAKNQRTDARIKPPSSTKPVKIQLGT